MKRGKILSIFLFLLLLTFIGCEDNDISPISASENNIETESLSKRFSGNNNVNFYTLSNSAAGNEVLKFSRPGHSFSLAGTYPTGGLGTGSGLGSQGALVVSGKFLFAVNAGSNDISVFSINHGGLTLVDKKPSGGTMPISLTSNNRNTALYVLNAGGNGNIAGFRITRYGKLFPISGSIKPLSNSSAAPAQIEFSPNGRILVVTEKANNVIDTYVVGFLGRAYGPTVHSSSGNTPYGFEFDRKGHLIVSEAFGGNAGLGAMSSYNVRFNRVNLISGTVADGQTAPCWVVITKNGKYAYTSNTGTGNISGYKIKHNGALELLNDGGNTGSTGEGSMPIDMAVSKDSQILLALNSGNQTISVFGINNGDGGLTSIETITGLPAGSVGLDTN